MQPHDFEKDTSYWTEAVVFVTPDGTLEKGRIKYLENRFYTLAKEAGRYLVKNGNTPKQSPVSEPTQALLDEFISYALLVTPALGHIAFEPLQPSSAKKKDDEGGLHFSRNRGKGGHAIGKVASDGFWLLRGSFLYPEIAPYTPKKIKELREEYADFISADGILQKDIVFGSPSYAATFVCGKNTNGQVEWKYEDGTPLKDVAISQSPAPSAVSKKSTAAPAQGQNSDEKIIFRFKSKKVVATGRLSGNGFIVFKGSAIRPDERNSCAEYIREKRKKLIETRKIKDNVFVEDTFFETPSGAAVMRRMGISCG